MITVLHLIPTLEGGGAERQLAILAKQQSEYGLKVHIVLTREGGNIKILNNSAVNIHRISIVSKYSPMYLVTFLKLFQKIKPDLIHTWLPQMDILGGILSFILCVPWVSSERSSKKAYSKYSYLTWMRYILISFSSVIVANSEQGANYWRRSLFVNNNKVFIIKNCIEASKINKANSVLLDRSDKPKHCILSVGRLVNGKSVDTLIRAIPYCLNKNNIHVLILGQGDLQGELESIIKTLGLNKHITIMPYQQEWYGMLKSATALVSMSEFEGTPNVLLEAVHAGCPVIVSDIQEHREIFDNKSAYFVPLKSYKKLAIAIDHIFDDPLRYKNQAVVAKSMVKIPTISAVYQSYLSVYKKILRD